MCILFNWPVNKNCKFWEVNYLSLGGFSVFGALVFIPRNFAPSAAPTKLPSRWAEKIGHEKPARWRFLFAMGKWQVKRCPF